MSKDKGSKETKKPKADKTVAKSKPISSYRNESGGGAPQTKIEPPKPDSKKGKG